MELGPWVELIVPVMGKVRIPSSRSASLLIDGEVVGQLTTMPGFNSQVSFSGLDIGLDRGSPVSHYQAPFKFSGGKLYKVRYTLDPLQQLDLEQVGKMEMGRQ